MHLVADIDYPKTEHDRRLVFEQLRAMVPGVVVTRDKGVVHLRVRDHGVQLLASTLEAFGLTPRWAKPGGQGPLDYAEEGFLMALGLEQEGTLKAGQVDLLTEYQAAGAGLAWRQKDEGLWMPCGSGKTFVALIWSLWYHTTVVYCTRVGALRTVETELRLRTNVKPLVWRPISLRRTKTWIPVDVYAGSSGTHFYIVGYENLPSFLDEVRCFCPLELRRPVVVFDEIHKLSSHKRWTMEVDDDGNKTFYRRRIHVSEDDQGDIAVPVAAMELSRKACAHLSLTATPIPDCLRNLWAQLDLVQPRDWGGYWAWATRYCNAHPGLFGGMDDTGVSNFEELDARLKYMIYAVDPEVVTASRPFGYVRQTVYLDGKDLDNPLDGWKSELKAAARVGAEASFDCQLGINAGRKRRWIVERVLDSMESGQKVVIFSYRKKDVERLGADIRKGVASRATKGRIVATTPVWWTHGDLHGLDERHALCEDFKALDGPGCLVGTGQSIGESANLQRTDLVIFAMLPWRPIDIEQQEGRFVRLGQDRQVLFLYVVAEGTIDERVVEVQLSKLPVVSQVTGNAYAAEVAECLRGVEGAAELVADLMKGICVDGPDWTIEED